MSEIIVCLAEMRVRCSICSKRKHIVYLLFDCGKDQKCMFEKFCIWVNMGNSPRR